MACRPAIFQGALRAFLGADAPLAPAKITRVNKQLWKNLQRGACASRTAGCNGNAPGLRASLLILWGRPPL